MTELRSVPKPASEAQSIGERSRLEAVREARAAPLATPRALAVGRSDRSLLPSGPRLETVIDLDERTRITATEQAPWRSVCALEIDSPGGSLVGTAWFAGPRTLITAGHCVFDRNQMGGWASKITVTPGRDRAKAPFGSFVATSFSATDRWTEGQDPDFDIAAIHLSEPHGDELGWFAVGSPTDQELIGHLVNVSGYPAEPGGGAEQWWALNRIRAVTPRRIFYDVDTSGGQSGGPAYVVAQEGAPPVVVGIHAYGTGGTPGSIPLMVNSAPRIIPEVMAQIQAWVGQDSVRS